MSIQVNSDRNHYPCLIERWIHGVQKVHTKTLRFDEIEALDKLLPPRPLTPFEIEIPLEKSDKLTTDILASLSVSDEPHFASADQVKMGDFQDFYEEWSLLNSKATSSLNLRDGSLIDEVESPSLQEEEYPRLISMLPEDSGSRYYDYSNPHLKMNKILFPRRLLFEEDSAPVEDSDNECTKTCEKFGWYCQDLACSQCEEHLLLMRYETTTLPKDYCQFLLDYKAIRLSGTSDLAFQCQFCQGSRWIPIQFHKYHLRHAHGIVEDQDDITLIAHPKLLYEQLTTRGYFTACLCGTCNSWRKLSPDQLTKYGGLFEPFFRHLMCCYGETEKEDITQK